jgi:hypothetical protein
MKKSMLRIERWVDPSEYYRYGTKECPEVFDRLLHTGIPIGHDGSYEDRINRQEGPQARMKCFDPCAIPLEMPGNIAQHPGFGNDAAVIFSDA